MSDTVHLFGIDLEELQKINEWYVDVCNRYIKENKLDEFLGEDKKETYLIEEIWDYDLIKTGAIGGALTYSFTPTSLGEIKVVLDSVTGEKLDYTDYENW